MKTQRFQIGGRTYRFARQIRMEAEHGYRDTAENHYNLVQRKRWWGWQTVEEELIPSFAWIAVATLGSTDWKSEMIERWKLKAEEAA